MDFSSFIFGFVHDVPGPKWSKALPFIFFAFHSCCLFQFSSLYHVKYPFSGDHHRKLWMKGQEFI